MGTWTWRGYISSDEHVITGEGAGIDARKGPMDIDMLSDFYMKLPGIKSYAEKYPPEMWGPYKKTMVQRLTLVHQPPVDVDGVPILCQCRNIGNWMRSAPSGRLTLTAEGILLFGENPPACWEDNMSISNPTGGNTYNVYVRHPAFYQYALNRNGGIGIVENVLKAQLNPTAKLTILGIPIGLWGGRRRTKRKVRKSKKRKTQRR